MTASERNADLWGQGASAAPSSDAPDGDGRETLRAALADAIYEVTHLSTSLEDGRYRPIIRRERVDAWRAVLASDAERVAEAVAHELFHTECQHDWRTRGHTLPVSRNECGDCVREAFATALRSWGQGDKATWQCADGGHAFPVVENGAACVCGGTALSIRILGGSQ